jgi:hypothetical protein
MQIRLGDEFVREVVERARELGLLHGEAEKPAQWLTTKEAADYLGCSEGQVLKVGVCLEC